MNWKVFFASATGKYHLTSNAPCEDAGHYAVVDGVLIGVVCDGAGSASEAQAGSEFLARRVIELVAEAVRAGRFAYDPPSGHREALAAIIEAARAELGEIAASRQRVLRDFATTLVGCLVTGDGGCFFHIGDGFAVYTPAGGESVISYPENGEYAHETFFVTDDDWNEHFRITPFTRIEPGDLIGLMSDGVSPFAINRPRTGFYGPFIDPVVAFLKNATEYAGSQALKSVLESEKTYEITSDDKTLLLALVS